MPRWDVKPDACPHDHPYTEENTYVDRRGFRRCRACRRKNSRAYRARHSM